MNLRGMFSIQLMKFCDREAPYFGLHGRVLTYFKTTSLCDSHIMLNPTHNRKHATMSKRTLFGRKIILEIRNNVQLVVWSLVLNAGKLYLSNTRKGNIWHWNTGVAPRFKGWFCDTVDDKKGRVWDISNGTRLHTIAPLSRCPKLSGFLRQEIFSSKRRRGIAYHNGIGLLSKKQLLRWVFLSMNSVGDCEKSYKKNLGQNVRL